MLLKVILEGLGLGAMLVCVCLFAIRHGAVGAVHLYHEDVQQRCIALGLTTKEKIQRTSARLKLVCIPLYLAYLLVCVYAVNGARGFVEGFWQLFVILSVMNLVDRFGIDDYWVLHTTAWDIPGTEDLKPYIDPSDKKHKWFVGVVVMVLLAAILAAVMSLILK